MRVDALKPRPQERLSFDRGSVARMKPGSGCYVLASRSGRVLYIGKAVDVRRRLEQHLDDPAKKGDSRIGFTVAVWLDRCDVDDVAELESEWTRQHEMGASGRLPPMNSIRPPWR